MSTRCRPIIATAAWRRAATVGLIVVFLAAALAFSGPAMAYLPPGGGWEYLDRQDFAYTYGVAFGDATHGWAVGDDYDASSAPHYFGAIAATVNGGATWTPRVSGTGSALNAVSFADALHGCAVGDGGVIVTSVNGGATWTPRVSGTTYDLMGVSFPRGDAKHGWAIGRSYSGGYTSLVLGTADGGLSWDPLLPGVPDELTGVSFPDATHGWAVTFDGVIYATADGGASWTHRRMTNADNHPVGLVFPDATHGWAVGGTEIEPWGTLIWATADGGATWKLQNKGGGPEEGMRAIAVPDVMHGCVVGEAGSMMATRTGGKPPVTVTLTGLTHGALRLGHRVTAAGVVTPAGAAGDDVRLTVQKKRGARWVAATAVSRTQGAAGSYRWKYKAGSRGTYRMKVAVDETAGHPAATTMWSQFRVS